MNFASTILMIRPAAFGYNSQTAVNNAFQNSRPLQDLEKKVAQEFNATVEKLRSYNIDVLIVDDTAEPPKPDAIFPNNWFCTLADGTICTFPMFAENRRVERRKDIIEKLMHDFVVHELEDWTSHEEYNLFLEGTGSMVFDHEHAVLYACLSDRSHPLLLAQFAQKMNYKLVAFSAKDKKGVHVYHTNVLMCIGNGFCVLCTDVIDVKDIELVKESLNSTKREIVSITYYQMLQFAGNMLQVKNKDGEYYLVMSQSAFDALDEHQLTVLQKYTMLLPVSIPTIEAVGGGSARCMMAEIFLNKRARV